VNEPKRCRLDRLIQALKISVARRQPERPFWQALLRLQCALVRKDDREAEVSSSQSSRTRAGQQAGGLAVVE
jgi:hypothetical protein